MSAYNLSVTLMQTGYAAWAVMAVVEGLCRHVTNWRGQTATIIVIPADDGLTHSALEFNLTEEGFDEDSGVEGVEILQKRKKAALVDILDLATGQLLETFDQEGKPAGVFTIKKVDSDLDTLVVQGEDGEEVDLRFGFRGVDDSMPFRVIRGRQAQEKPQDADADADEEEANAEEGEDEGEEAEDFTFLDDELEEAPADEDVQQLIEIPTSERVYSNIMQKSEA